jgi:ABC-type branched-subunit amino acid transport system ATPase component/sugar phosphate permease
MTAPEAPRGRGGALVATKPSQERAEELAAEQLPPSGKKPPRPGGFRATLAEARNWKELRRSPYGMTPLVIMALASFFGEFRRTALGLAAPNIIQDLDIDLAGYLQYSGLVEFFGVFAVIGVAYWCDRHRRVPLYGGGLVAGGLFGMLTSRATSLFTLGAPQTGAAVSFTAAGVPVTSLIPDYYPPAVRGRAYAFRGLALTVGGAVVVLPAGEFLERFGWRSVYVTFGALTAAVGVLALLRLREPVRGYFERLELGASVDVAEQADEPPSFGEAWRTVWGVRTLRRIFIGDIFTSAGSAIFSSLSGFYFLQEYGLDIRERSYVFFALGLFGLAGGYIGGGMVDSIMKRRPGRALALVGVFSAIAAVGYLILPIAPPLPVTVVALGLIGFGGALLRPALGVFYANIMPANVRTLGTAVRELSEIPAAIIFLPLAGVIVANYGIKTALIVPIPLLVIGGLVLASASTLFDTDMRSAFASTLAREDWRRAQDEGRGKLLVCRDVDVHYGGVQVLFGVDFEVEQGDIIALLGTNGAGKSTLLRAISGSQQASSGGIVFDGREITYMPPHETAARGIIHMPGGRGVFPALTVKENLLLGAWLLEDAAEQQARLAEVYEIFPALASRRDVPASTLSGGEQQQLSLAQAFLAKPRLLMIDELSLGLSPAVVGQLLEIVRKIHESGVTIIVVEQSVNVALTLAEKAIFMEKGEVKFYGRTADLMARPDILRAVYVKGTGALTESAPRRPNPTGEATQPVLEVQGIRKRFGGVQALDGVDLTLSEGEVLGLIGPNGSGKTTLFEIISGFQKADEGTIRFEGVDITDMSPEQRAQRKLIRRFQDARLFPSLSVYETLLVALEQRMEVKNSLLHVARLPQARRAERRVRLQADRLVELLELGSYRDKFVKELSTGLRRIVDLACVLANEPRVLLLDEPSSGIAQAEAEGLGPLLRRVRFETGCSILIIEHDMPLISAVSDEIVALQQGQVLLRGTAETVLNDERVIQAYLGGSEEAVRRSGSLT